MEFLASDGILVSNDLKIEFLAGAAAKGFENHESRISKNERRMEEMQMLIDKLQTLIASGNNYPLSSSILCLYFG